MDLSCSHNGGYDSMVCPACGSEITDDKQNRRFTCEQCLSKLIHSQDKGLREIVTPKVSQPLGEVIMVNGNIQRRNVTIRHSHPNQPLYEINGCMYMDCVGCNVPTPYTSMVKGRFWDLGSQPKIKLE